MNTSIICRFLAILAAPVAIYASALPRAADVTPRSLVPPELAKIRGGIPERECAFEKDCGATPKCDTYTASVLCAGLDETTQPVGAGTQECTKVSTKTCTDDAQGINDCAVKYQCEDDPDSAQCRTSATVIEAFRAAKQCTSQ